MITLHFDINNLNTTTKTTHHFTSTFASIEELSPLLLKNGALLLKKPCIFSLYTLKNFYNFLHKPCTNYTPNKKC